MNVEKRTMKLFGRTEIRPITVLAVVNFVWYRWHRLVFILKHWPGQEYTVQWMFSSLYPLTPCWVGTWKTWRYFVFCSRYVQLRALAVSAVEKTFPPQYDWSTHPVLREYQQNAAEYLGIKQQKLIMKTLRRIKIGTNHSVWKRGAQWIKNSQYLKSNFQSDQN